MSFNTLELKKLVELSNKFAGQYLEENYNVRIEYMRFMTPVKWGTRISLEGRYGSETIIVSESYETISEMIYKKMGKQYGEPYWNHDFYQHV